MRAASAARTHSSYKDQAGPGRRSRPPHDLETPLSTGRESDAPQRVRNVPLFARRSRAGRGTFGAPGRQRNKNVAALEEVDKDVASPDSPGRPPREHAAANSRIGLGVVSRACLHKCVEWS
jgi:hypothetical protein